MDASSSRVAFVSSHEGTIKLFETSTWITAYDMIGFRIQDVVTIRYMDNPRLAQGEIRLHTKELQIHTRDNKSKRAL